jgi:hypothetical protein
MRASVDFSLVDQSKDKGRQGGTVKVGPNDVEVLLDGHGTLTMDPGHGPVILLEYLDGVPRLIVWADINQEDPTHVIELRKASEKARRKQLG